MLKNKSKQVCVDIWIIFWLAWTVAATMFWRAVPNMVNYPAQSLHAAAVQMVHGIMLAGIDLFVLSLGKVIVNRNNKGFLIASTWLVTVICGIACVLLLILRKQFAIADLYSALFPLLRNAIPLLSGIILALILLNLANHNDIALDDRLFFILLCLLLVPFVFGTDLWGFDQGTNPLFYTTICIMGGCSLHLKKRQLWLGFIVVGLIGVLLIGVMPSISVMLHGDASTADRLTTIANPFLIFSACCLLGLLSKKVKFSQSANWTWWLTVISLTMTFTPAMVSQVNGILVRHTHHSTAKLLLWAPALTVILLLASLVTTGVLTWLDRKIHLWKKLAGWLGQFVDQTNVVNWQAVQQFAKQYVKKHLAGIWLVIIAYFLALVSMLLTNDSLKISPNTGGTFNTFTYTFFARQSLVILNALIIGVFICFLWSLTRHYFVSLFATIFLITMWVIANQLKIAARNEPILPADLRLAGVGTSILGMVSLWVYLAVGVFLIVLIAVCMWCERHYAKTAPHKLGTITALIVFPLIALSSLGWNHQSTALNKVVTGFGDVPMFYNQLSGARINGPVVQFMNNIDVKVMDKPAGYSKASMIKLRKRYLQEAQQINKHRQNQLSKQTIIFNLSESFADPRRVPSVTIAHNPIPNVDRLKKNNTSGLMISSGYGGGTANMEYMTLTGFALANFSPTLPTPYTQLVVKLIHNPSIVGSFNHSTAIHPYLGTFYSRETVYKKFGIQHFYFLGNKNYPIRHRFKIQDSPYQSDHTSYDNVMDQIHRQSHGQFIQLVTMQNHFPYSRNFYHHSSYYHVTAHHGTDKNALADYTEGIHYTDQAVKKFTKQLDRVQRPITVVFYGDHLPGSIYGNSMKKDGLKLHETDYFIYSNRYARQHGAKTKMAKDTNVVAPNDFIAMVAAQTNSKVDWYQALLTKVWQDLPAVALQTNQGSSQSTNTYNTAPEFINSYGKITSKKHWTKHQKQIWHDYQLVQYDVTAGHQYLVRGGQLK